MPDTVRVEFRAHPLGDDVQKVVLKVLRNPRNEGNAHRCSKQQADASEELPRRELVVLSGVLIDDFSHDNGIQHRKKLVDGRQDQRQADEKLVVFEVIKKKFHRKILADWELGSDYPESLFTTEAQGTQRANNFSPCSLCLRGE